MLGRISFGIQYKCMCPWKRKELATYIGVVRCVAIPDVKYAAAYTLSKKGMATGRGHG